MSDRQSGILITFEGLEGCGKSTNAAFVGDYLREKGIPVVNTREPGGTAIGQKVRDLLLAEHDEVIHPLSELYLMFASRAQLLATKIKPALDRGVWVVCDRYVDSSFAYQGGGRDLGEATVQQLVEGLGPLFIKPDLTFFLDIKPETIEGRLRQRSLKLKDVVVSGERLNTKNQGSGDVPDRFEREDLDFFKSIRNLYLARAANQHVITIDAEQSLDRVEQDVLQHIDKLLVMGECAECQ